MTRFATVFAAVSMLVLPAATAFAGEGTYAPAAVASPASGPAIDRGTGASFVFATPSGSYGDVAAPAQAGRAIDRGTVRLGSYGFNAGLNG